MKRTHIEDLQKGEEATIKGWVNIRRDHGKLIFIDLRDATGRVQMVVLPEHKEAGKIAETIRPEWIIEVEGVVNERPEKMRKDEQNGDIEIEAKKITVISEAETPPFEISENTGEINEETRLKYRYLDLRSERMQKNIKVRSEFIQKCREYLFKQKFTEIETPILTESTPEGSRDFVVPARLHPGKFYALPQSPQQYKQLLMVAGFERYFQLARAVRDEDLRADRGFEHTQVDIETSFVNQSDVLDLIEGMMVEVVESMGYTIKEKPFPRITYKEAMEKYGADKFDLRTEEDKEKGILAYAWVVDFPFFEKTDSGKWTFSHNPFSMPKEEHIEDLLKGENIENIITQQYDLVCNGFESGGGSIRSHRTDVLKAVYKVMGYSEEETEERIGHMLEAFKYGVPPHGGIALGVERNIMNLTNESYLREVQSFPMTRGGQTSVMKAPKELTPEQLAELHLRIDKENK
ncbi:MAG: OB-fold nucleic acid binding domain-containing protein [Candidatus Pacebacteria bacterium]|nr:OB-fold nucleic acid binding domain-containing protein [Candidatus Paceibacterota bacterium]